jgi:Lipase.
MSLLSTDPFDCNHRRAPQYFAESINSKEGFWGFPCAGIISYLFGMCPVKEPIKLMGEMCAER